MPVTSVIDNHPPRAVLQAAGLHEIRCTALAIWARTALSGISMPAIATMFLEAANRRRGRQLLAWIVVIDPSWPVFMALKHVDHFLAAGFPLTMIRSGRIRSAFLRQSRWVTAPLPSTFGGAAFHPAHMDLLKLEFRGILDRQGMRSLLSMKDDSALRRWSSCPRPVPPETMTLRRVATAAWM